MFNNPKVFGGDFAMAKVKPRKNTNNRSLFEF